MNDSEKVDGLEIAASILRHFPEEQRKRLIGSIQKKSPRIGAKLAENIFKFEEIVLLTDNSIQMLMTMVDYQELVLALRGTDRDFLAVITRNLSQRKGQTLLEDIDLLGPQPKSEVESARSKIARLVDDLRTSGRVRYSAE